MFKGDKLNNEDLTQVKNFNFNSSSTTGSSTKEICNNSHTSDNQYLIKNKDN